MRIPELSYLWLACSEPVPSFMPGPQLNLADDKKSSPGMDCSNVTDDIQVCSTVRP
jgi:hypothetical protein